MLLMISLIIETIRQYYRRCKENVAISYVVNVLHNYIWSFNTYIWFYQAEPLFAVIYIYIYIIG